MRKTYRNRKNKDYWNSRWNDIPADKPMTNTSAYPSEICIGDRTINRMAQFWRQGAVQGEYFGTFMI